MYRLPSPPPALAIAGLPSAMPWQDRTVAEELAELERLPREDRRQTVRDAIREREAELALYVEAHPGPVDLRAVRVDDERLNGLRLVDALLAS